MPDTPRDDALADNEDKAVLDFIAKHPPAPGRCMPIYVLHDDACSVHGGGECDCDPIVRAGKP